MNLWDKVIAPHEETIDNLDRAQRCGLAVDVIEATRGLFTPPFDEFFPPVMRDLIVSTVAEVKSSAPEWELREEFVDDFHQRWEAVMAARDVPALPGSHSFVNAMLDLVDGVTEDMPADNLIEVLSNSYDAILVSQGMVRPTVETEKANENCARAIAIQEQLIARYSSAE